MADFSYTEMEVRFDKWCKLCKYWDKEGSEEPCFKCLDHPTNWDTDKPEYYEEK